MSLPTPDDAGARRAFGLALALVAGLTAARVAALFASPLELYPDEAQYWLWSRTLAGGYFSKPPMVAWAIRATTALGGDGEPWVRLAAPLFQAGATLCAYALGRRLYGASAGLAAAAIYGLSPAVQLSAAVIATDAPLLFFLGLALLAYAALPAASGRRKLAAAAALGVATGLAFLSKYASVYFLIGAAAHLAASREARRAWTAPAAAVAAGGAMAVLAPNLAWNAAHGFATVQHTVADANWDRGDLANPAALARFLVGQVLIFGPIPALALVAGGAAAAWRRRRLAGADLMLACFAAAPIGLVAAQAFISRANANWAAAGYLPAAVLAAGLLVRRRRWLTAALGMQGVAAAAFLLMVAAPQLAAALGADNSFKRVRGWRETTAAALARARAEQTAGGLTAVAVDNRFLFYAMAYYGRAYFADPANPPLRAWLPEARPQNQAELSAPLTPALGSRALVVSYEGWRAADVAADFRRVGPAETLQVPLDRKRRRKVVMFVGEGLASPKLSGRATPP